MGLVDAIRLPGQTMIDAARSVAGAVSDAVAASGAVDGRAVGGRAVGGRASGDRPRRVATSRVAITVPGLDRPDAAQLRLALREAVDSLPGVAWTAVNAPLRRLVIGICDPAPTHEELAALVESVRKRYATPPSGTADTAEPPDDPGPITRAVTALAADTAGLALAITGRLVRRIPGASEVASLITIVDTQPRIRAAVDRALGRTHADTLIAVTNAAAQGLAGGTASLGIDATLRIGQLAEARARRSAWTGQEARLFDDAVRAGAEPVVAERPRPLPDGPVERYAPRSAGLGAVGAGVALAAGGAGRATGIALASLPKAAGAGREMFAARLGRVLAQRGAQVMDHRVLRRLDRIDTVVLDVGALTTGRSIVSEVVALPGTEQEAAELRVHALFRQRALSEPVQETPVREGLKPGRPEQGRPEQGRPDGANGSRVPVWRLGPIERLDLRGRTGARERNRLVRAGAGQVLGLALGTRLHAVVAVATEPAGNADALVAAARRAGAELVFAGGRPPAGAPVSARELPGGRRLVGTVRQLQAEGRAVLLVSRHRAGLASADCGVGVDADDGTPPWGAHVMIGDDLELAALLIDGIDTARTVSQRGVLLAEAGSALGAVTTVTGRPAGSARRALLAVNGAAALSVLHGGWAANELARRPLSPPVSTTPWHALPARRVLSILDAGTGGLTTRQADQRRQPNRQVNPEPASFGRAFAEELANPLTPILAGGAGMSAAIGSVIDAGIVIGASAIGALVGSVQRTVTDRAVAELLARSAVVTTVRRDGKQARIRADLLVPGDVVTLAPDDVVPADCRLLGATDLEMDESSLTGESFPVAKSPEPVAASTIADRTSMVYEGTTVAAGRAVAVVVATGADTEAGRGMATAAQSVPPSGVEARLAQITRTTLPIALGSGGAVMAAGLLRGQPVQRTVGAGVGLAVASVPEGLPFLVSAAQLAAARRLSRIGALVRNARTIEALGRVDVLCFDKTGTLTQGRIRLAAVSDGAASGPVGQEPTAETPPAQDPVADDQPATQTAPSETEQRFLARQRAVVAAGLRATPAPPPGQKLPHPTDRAVRYGADDLDVTEDLDAPGWSPVSALPFEPSRSYHATLGNTDGGSLLSVKGAPEVVLPRCVSWRTERGERRIESRDRRQLRDEMHRLTGQGYRVLAVAQARPDEPGELADEQVRELCLLGFLALADPVRGSAGASLDELRAAGAQIVMITGDHPITAEAIADELGILNGHRVVTGAEIDGLDDEELAELVPGIAVVARGTPAHKVRVVRAFQSRGRVVAMTGDGANDAPAIRLADVGIALGRRGTPAARAAADLIVTDDRLETIIAALVEGRAMWKSVREALGILVGGNIGEIGFTVLGSAVAGASPLNPRQLLLVNLLTDLAPALAIALRRPDPSGAGELLREGPETSLGTALTREVTVRAATTTAGATAGWVAARLTGGERRARTVALAALVGSQLGQTLLIGRTSPGVLVASLGSAGLLAGVIQTPGLSQFFDCTPLGPVGWGIALASAGGATVGAAALPQLLRYLPAEVTERIESTLDPSRLAGLLRSDRFAGLLGLRRPS